MIQHIRLLILSVLLVLGIGVCALPSMASASEAQVSACNGLSEVDSTQGCDSGGSNLTKVVSGVVQVLSYVVGIAAVIMIIISGFRYITSGGDSGKVSGAKSALIYALVGLIVAALAQLLVHFVLNQSFEATKPNCTIEGKTNLKIDDKKCQ